MNQELLEQLKDNMDGLAASGALEAAKIFLFGMNTPGDRVIQYLEAKGYALAGVLDNNKKNQGKTLLGVEVFSPEMLKSAPLDAVRILICSKYYQEMKAQLNEMGFAEGTHIFKLLELNKGTAVSTAEDIFWQEADRLRGQLAVCQKQLQNYAADAEFLLCPVRANGDIYICASLAEQVQKERGLKQVVLVASGGVGKKIAGMFGLRHVLIVTPAEMEAMVSVVRVLGSRMTRMTVVHPETFYYNIFFNMECLKGLNFTDFIAHGALGLTEKTGQQCPEKSPYPSDSRPFLGKRDVLLAPYANSLPCFPKAFWETLVQALKKKAYRVYTNSNGSMEPPVLGTEPVFLPFENLLAEAAGSGGFIGIRNGLCEILSTADCQKIILYPEKGMGLGTVKDYYGLGGMGLCEDAHEIVYREGKEAQVIEQILQYFE